MKVHLMNSKRYWINLLIIIGVLVGLFGCSVWYIKSNLANISDNRPITWLEGNSSSEAQNHHADVIFYRDTCPHCRRVIPVVYILNNLMASNNRKDIEYRDINNPTNQNIGIVVGDKSFPESKEITMKHGMRYVRKQSLLQTHEGLTVGELLSLYAIFTMLAVILLAFVI